MSGLLIKLKQDYLLWLLLWLALLLVFSYSWLPGGLDVDSCNYALVAKEALNSGHWLKLYDPTVHDNFYYHFPLYIWVTVFFFKIFGINVFSAILFSSLSLLALTALIFYLGRLLAGQWVGFFAGFSFLVTNHIVRLARLARMDIPVTLFITAAMLCFVLAQRRSRWYYLLFGLFTSLAIFTKDIFGVAPLAIVFIYLVLLRRWKEFFHPLFLAGIMVTFLPIVVWIKLDNNTLFHAWYRYNFLHLYKSPSFKISRYYYIKAVATKYFYFLPFAVYGGYLALKRARRDKQPEFYLLIIWALIFPLAFSFGKQKLHYFIIAMYPASAVLAGLAFERLIKDALKPRAAKALFYLLVIYATLMLIIPMDIRSRRFDEIVTMAPATEQILRQLPEYEFIVYKYDTAAVLWYVQSLCRVTYCNDQAALDNLAVSASDKPRLYFLREADLLQSPALYGNCRVLFKYKDRVLAVSPKNLVLTVVLPDA